jgi:hypothetical protein
LRQKRNGTPNPNFCPQKLRNLKNTSEFNKLVNQVVTQTPQARGKAKGSLGEQKIVCEQHIRTHTRKRD